MLDGGHHSSQLCCHLVVVLTSYHNQPDPCFVYQPKLHRMVKATQQAATTISVFECVQREVTDRRCEVH